MALKFKCAKCGGDIVVKFLRAGEKAKCRKCGTENAVPSNAPEITNEQAEAYAKPAAKSKDDKTAPAPLSCVTCRHFEDGEDDAGKCHRYPPDNYEYPIVTDADWCGEYVVKN